MTLHYYNIKSVHLFFLSQMNPESRPSFTELVAELEKRVSDGEQSESIEPDVQGESAKKKHSTENVLSEGFFYFSVHTYVNYSHT